VRTCTLHHYYQISARLRARIASSSPLVDHTACPEGQERRGRWHPAWCHYAKPLGPCLRELIDLLVSGELLGTFSRVWLGCRIAGVVLTLQRRIRAARTEYVRCKRDHACPWHQPATGDAAVPRRRDRRPGWGR
jgi:hypothetical protein